MVTEKYDKTVFLPSLSVVVPVHNEAGNIEPLLTEIYTSLTGGWLYEVVYVDDGSTDHTWDELKGLQTRFPFLRLRRHKYCCGQSTALRTGILAAQFDVIVTLDGDGQNDPSDIPNLLATWSTASKNGKETMVVGYRKDRKDTSWRRFSSQVANRVRSALLKDNTLDTGCGLKVFSRQLFIMLPYFDHMHRFLPALAQRTGGQVFSVEVQHRPRTCGESKYGTWKRLWGGIWDLLGVLWLQRRTHQPVIEEGDADAETSISK